jgi:CBS domain containing-hemolysin-like protein
MENVLDLEDKIARRYMVPRNQIVFLNKQDPMDKKLETASQSGHSRFPLCEGDLDHIVGIVHVKDVSNAMNLEGDLSTLVQVAREPLFLPETIRLDSLLKEFQRSHSHLVILVDEYGGVSGMITLENVIEEMVGPIEDEFDAETPLVVPLGPGRFEVDASCSIDEFARKCVVELPQDSEADSVGGLVIEAVGHIPRIGETTPLSNALITVLESEPTRVRRVLVEKTAATGPSREA